VVGVSSDGGRVVLEGPLDRATEERLEAAALRIYGRYQREFVEALGLCPWAVRAREEGKVAVHALLEPAEGLLKPTLAAVGQLGADESVEVGLLVFPRSAATRAEHEAFVSAVRERDAELHDGSPPMAMAAFHPDAEADFSHPSRLVPFIRRSPDPVIQLIRRSSLEAVRKRTSDRGTAFLDPSEIDFGAMLEAPTRAPLHERVAESNRETIQELGVKDAERILAAIAADRDEAYRRLAVEADS
jgi:hypothetical protein